MTEEVIYTNNIKAVRWLKRFFAAQPDMGDLSDDDARKVVISLARGDDPDEAATAITAGKWSADSHMHGVPETKD